MRMMCTLLLRNVTNLIKSITTIDLFDRDDSKIKIYVERFKIMIILHKQLIMKILLKLWNNNGTIFCTICL